MRNKLPKNWFIIWESEKNYNIISQYFKEKNIPFPWVFHNSIVHNKAGNTSDAQYVLPENISNDTLKYRRKGKLYNKITFDEFIAFVVNNDYSKSNKGINSQLKLLLNKLNIE